MKLPGCRASACDSSECAYPLRLRWSFYAAAWSVDGRSRSRLWFASGAWAEARASWVTNERGTAIRPETEQGKPSATASEGLDAPRAE